jgi:hypothetical protein
MKTKMMLFLSGGLNVALVGALTFIYKQIPDRDFVTANGVLAVKSDRAGGVRSAQSEVAPPRLGAVIETLLPCPKDAQKPELFDFETGRRMTEPDLAAFEFNTRASAAWIRANGLDIAGVNLQSGDSICFGYYLAVVPVAHQLWEAATPAVVPPHPELDAIREPKRPIIAPAQSHTDTFLFRTTEGTTGMLQILGPTEDRRCVKIRYKLLALAPGVGDPNATLSTAVVGTPTPLSGP